MAFKWTAEADAALQAAVYATAFDFAAVSVQLRQLVPGVDTEICRLRFAQLQGGGELLLDPVAASTSEELDLDSLLDGDQDDNGLSGLDIRALRTGQPNQLHSASNQLRSNETGANGLSSVSAGAPSRSSLLLDSSAFDFDADAALAEADAHIGAAIDAAMLAKIRSGGTVSEDAPTRGMHVISETATRIATAATVLGGVGATEATDDFDAADELARIEALSASRGAARRAVQNAMFERVLGALGGPLAEEHARHVLLPSAEGGGRGGRSALEHAGAGQGTAAAEATATDDEDDEDARAAAAMERVTAAFHASTSTRGGPAATPSSRPGAGPPGAGAGSLSGAGLPMPTDAYEPSSASSMFRGKDTAATLAAWDVLLRDVPLPDPSSPSPASKAGRAAAAGTGAAGTGAAGTGTGSAAFSAGAEASAEGADADVKPEDTSMASVLAFLAAQSQLHKEQQMLAQAARFAASSSSAVSPSVHGVAPPMAPPAAGRKGSAAVPPTLPQSPSAASTAAGAPSGPSRASAPAAPVGRVGAPQGRHAVAKDRYAGEGNEDNEEEEEEMVDLRAQRAALKAQGAQAATLPAPVPRPEETADGPSDLMRLLRAGRAATGVKPLPAASAEVEAEDEEEGPEEGEVQDAGAGEGEGRGDFPSVGRQAALSVASLLATVGAVSQAMVQAGAIEPEEAGLQLDAMDVPDVDAGRRSHWVHGAKPAASPAKDAASAGTGPGAAAGKAGASPAKQSTPVKTPGRVAASPAKAAPSATPSGASGVAPGTAVAEQGAGGVGVDDQQEAGGEEVDGAGGFSTRVIRKIAAESATVAAASRTAATTVPVAGTAVPAISPWNPTASAGAATRGKTVLPAKATAGAGKAGAGAAVVPPPVPSASSGQPSAVGDRVDPSLLRAVLAGPSAASVGSSTSARAPPTLQELQKGYLQRVFGKEAEGRAGTGGEDLPRLTS